MEIAVDDVVNVQLLESIRNIANDVVDDSSAFYEAC